jgi:hypothetical protein
MRDNLQLKKLVGAWLGALWTASAAAAQVTFVTDLASIPVAAVAVAVVIALIGGCASTLAKIASPDVAIVNLSLVVVRDIMASLVAGLATFFFCAWREWSPLLAAICILIAGYGGSRVLERYLAAGMSQIDRLAGKPGETP